MICDACAVNATASGCDDIRRLDVCGEAFDFIVETVLLHVDHDPPTISCRWPSAVKSIKGSESRSFKQIVVHLSALDKLRVTFFMGNSMLLLAQESARECSEIANLFHTCKWQKLEGSWRTGSHVHIILVDTPSLQVVRGGFLV